MIANPNISQQLELGGGIAKRGISLLGAGGVTVGLLFLMTQLISSDMPVLEEERSFNVPSISFVPKDTPPETIEITRPVIKEKPQVPEANFIPDNTPSIDAIKVPIAKYEGSKPTIVGGLPGGMALVPISPQFPETAARRGLCGHATVQFDINADGIPINVAVLDSSHRAFNKSSVQAVERARYKPSVQGGQPVAIYGRVEKISYRLEGGC